MFVIYDTNERNSFPEKYFVRINPGLLSGVSTAEFGRREESAKFETWADAEAALLSVYQVKGLSDPYLAGVDHPLLTLAVVRADA